MLMNTVVKLKIILACYLFYMLGGILSAIFVETNNQTGTITAIVLPTCISMACVTILTQQVPTKKKRLPPMKRRASRAKVVKN